MPKPKEVEVMTAFGESIDSAMILAAQPDEIEQVDGAQRTLLLKIEGDVCRVVDTLPRPIGTSWRSNNGRVYCPSNGGQVLTYFDGAWDQEQVCAHEGIFGNLWGFSGKTPSEDIVFLCSDENLYIRDKGFWNEYPMPDTVEIVHGLHGLSPDQVYVCTDEGLLRWNGEELVELEGPPDDEPLGVLVLSKTDMLVSGYDLYLWSDKGGWIVLDSPAESHTIAMLSFGDDVFIGTTEGVLQRRSNKLEMVTDVFCNDLVNVGDGIIASGDATYLYDGRQWTQLWLPKLEVGEIPK